MPLIIFEMASKQIGDLAHGWAMIPAFAEVARPFQDTFRFVFKPQQQDPDSFIHSSPKGCGEVKYVKRFESTRVRVAGLGRLLTVKREYGFRTACTYFDEPHRGRRHRPRQGRLWFIRRLVAARLGGSRRQANHRIDRRCDTPPSNAPRQPFPNARVSIGTETGRG